MEVWEWWSWENEKVKKEEPKAEDDPEEVKKEEPKAEVDPEEKAP